jgi:predicted O-methyltransferase YrrM
MIQLKSLLKISEEEEKEFKKEYISIKEYIETNLGKQFPYALSESKREILYMIVRKTKPSIAVETGVGPGVSTIIILSALEDGKLYSIDLRDKLENGFSVGFLVPINLRSKWRLFIGESRFILPKILQKLNRVDIFLHDSEHTYENIMFELKTVWNKLSKGGIILVDNFEWNDATIDFVRENSLSLYKLSEEAGGLALIIKS